MSRKPLFILALLVISSLSCKKKIEQIKTNLLIDFVSSHNWIIVDFQSRDTTTNIITFKTDDYDGYEFDFKDNLTVDVLKDASVFASGTWDGIMGTGLSNSTIIAAFPSAAYPIDVMTGTWQTTNSNGDPVYFRAKRQEGVNELWFKMQAVE